MYKTLAVVCSLTGSKRQSFLRSVFYRQYQRTVILNVNWIGVDVIAAHRQSLCSNHLMPVKLIEGN
jgi:hypothetical protein